MLVDDEPDIRTVAEMSLSHVGGWHTLVATGGAEALKMAAEHKPDVIILDVMMPEMDGVATFEALSDNDATRDIPVIFMTAKIQPHERESYLRLGATGVIAKPFDPMGLPKEILRIVANPPPKAPTASTASTTARAAEAGAGATSEPTAEARVAELRERYAAKLAGNLEGLVNVIEAARAAKPEDRVEAVAAAGRVAHTLHGTAGTYGHEAFSTAMAQIELACQTLAAGDDPALWRRIDAALAEATRATS